MINGIPLYPVTAALVRYLGYDPYEISDRHLTPVNFQKVMFDGTGQVLRDDMGSPVTETEHWSDRGVDGWLVHTVFEAEERTKHES